ncbi:MAG: cell division protein FtsB [Thiohalomonadaceae bacterium]
MKRLLAAILLVFLAALQYRLWFSDGGLVKMWQLFNAAEAQKQENSHLLERNRALEAEVIDLKQGLQAIEERARTELGMVKKEETFFQIINDPEPAMPENSAQP